MLPTARARTTRFTRGTYRSFRECIYADVSAPPPIHLLLKLDSFTHPQTPQLSLHIPHTTLGIHTWHKQRGWAPVMLNDILYPLLCVCVDNNATWLIFTLSPRSGHTQDTICDLSPIPRIPPPHDMGRSLMSGQVLLFEKAVSECRKQRAIVLGSSW